MRKRHYMIGGVVALALIASIGTMLPRKSAMPGADATIGSATFDRAGFAQWWDSGAVPPTVKAVTSPERIRWTGVALQAETSIYPDDDAPAAARAVCSVLSAYWLTMGEFRPVRVLGTDGRVLVSRRSAAERCEWRG